ncbi:MAG TPA: hypothetical protein VFE61_09295 [Candidatus Sulfotelmatobacter sp.]|nr:hypothetical protein [Candidatus Sulfotelmatobacter sp.]
MTTTTRLWVRSRLPQWALAWAVVATLLVPFALTQTNPAERVFPQSKATVEKAVKALQASLSGHLPVLDGFAKVGDHPLDRYQRGYYQATVQVTSTASGGSLVRINTKVTAWYSDPTPSRSGYQLLISNGRLETDLLDQLTEQLGGPSESARASSPASRSKPTSKPPIDDQTNDHAKISAPVPESSSTDQPFSSSMSQSLAARERASAHPPAKSAADKAAKTQHDEVANLEEILKNQAHPKNLVAVKKSGTPVVATPSLTAKPQFLASMHDEFEMLDFNRDWVHVRVSGLSRGWIWRNSVEMPEGIADTDAPVASSQAPAADLFHVQREETASFPGDWGPLRGKNVKILSVQKVDDSAKDTGPRQRLEYAKFLLEKNYMEMSQKPQDAAGIVLIFDSADGGMIAATMATLQQWRAGKLSDSAFWHQCFFDPPEIFDPAGSAPSQ